MQDISVIEKKDVH